MANILSLLQLSLAILIAAVAYQNLFNIPSKEDVHMFGTVDSKFEKVKKAFLENLESGDDFGSSLVVYHKGKRVVHLFGGFQNKNTKTIWRENTLTSVQGVTASLASLAFVSLIDRKEISLDDKVVKYWPEFGQNGKQDVTILDVLTHRAGIPYFNETSVPVLKAEEMGGDQFEKAVKLQKLIHGNQPAFHAGTFGNLLNSIFKRVDPKHRTIAQYYEEEILPQLGLEREIYFGLPLDQFYRAANVDYSSCLHAHNVMYIGKNPWLLNYLTGIRASELAAAVSNPQAPSIKSTNDPYIVSQWRDSYSYGAFATADGLAKLFTILSRQTQQLSDDLVYKISKIQVNQSLVDCQDKVMDTCLPYNIGFFGYIYNILSLQVIFDKQPPTHLMAGFAIGGTTVFADPDNQLSVAYVTNTWSYATIGNDERVLKLMREVYNAIQ